jgi:choline dehydrogenase-like flavoprotein
VNRTTFTPFAALQPVYDAVVIGSGPGGSAVAYKLAKGGLRVLVVERGVALQAEEHVSSGPIGRHLYELVPQGESPSRFVGGQTKFYGAALYRMHASDFQETMHETGPSPAWPFAYEAIEPYYTEAEQLYKVHGSVGQSQGEPARSSPFPHPPIPHHPKVAQWLARVEAAGTPVDTLPKGLDYGPDGRCVLCATCDSYYCRLDAKMDAETAALRPAVATGRVDVVVETECLQVLTNAAGSQATGVQLRHGSEQRTVQAARVVVSAGLQGSIDLLWKSRMAAHPAGLGNNQGVLGRYLGGHSTGFVFPLTSWWPMPAMHTKTFSVMRYYEGAPDWPYPLGVIQAVGQMPFWRNASKLMRLPAWLIAQCSLPSIYMVETVPTHESGYRVTAEGVGERVEPQHALATFDKARQVARDVFKAAGFPTIARNHAPLLWHEVGGARIGTNPAQSVCDPDCQVHGIQGLYVVDASSLPTAGAVNTGLTIIALALKAGDAMLKRGT